MDSVGRGGAIVLGGSGFIGAHLLARLRAERPDAPIYSLDVTEPHEPVPGVVYLAGDVRHPIEHTFEGPIEAIYNLAAVHRTPGHEDYEYYETNIAGAVNSCALARRLGVETIVFTSSIAVYGPTETPKTETSPLQPVSAYGRSKLLAEKIQEDWRAQDPERRRLIVARPAVIFGPRENGNMTRLARFQSTGMFFFPGRRDTLKACGYVQELISALLFVRDSDLQALTFNFCYPKCYSVEEITNIYNEKAGLPKVRGTVPQFLALSGAAFFEIFGLFGIKTPINRARMRKMVESTNIVPERLVAADYPYQTDFSSAVVDWKASSPTGKLE